VDERGALAAVENDEFEHVPGRVGTPDEVAKGVFGDLFDGQGVVPACSMSFVVMPCRNAERSTSTH